MARIASSCVCANTIVAPIPAKPVMVDFGVSLTSLTKALGSLFSDIKPVIIGPTNANKGFMLVRPNSGSWSVWLIQQIVKMNKPLVCVAFLP